MTPLLTSQGDAGKPVKLSKQMRHALSIVRRERTVSDDCLSGCFGVASSTVRALAGRSLMEVTSPNPTAARVWRLTDAGLKTLSGDSHG